MEMAFKFDVVVSGISGRFPECDDIDTFKRKLYEGNSDEFITNNDKKWTRGFKRNKYGDKVAVPDATGKYTKDIEFDYRLFKFNQLFGRSTDVVNRKILEPSFEAIVDAGINPYSLDGANIGVFMTGGVPEREINSSSVDNTMRQLFILGHSRTMGPNRLSYALNLTGPSYAFHSDPLGGFAALKVAKELISDGSIEAAVVAVASNLIDPKFSYLYMYLDLLTSDECCRPFDKNANGFVRSEGAVVLFLQREQDAKRQYAKLLLCDTIFEGLSSHTLLGYDEEYLKNSLSKIYERNENASVVKDVAFVELTGCAVKRFDSAEANAVADVLCKQRMNPLMVGSTKSSVGHTEVASGFLSILTTLLALDSQTIAPNSNFSEVNDDIRAFRDEKMKVVDKKTELCGNIAAVNITGLWGTVNHVVLQNNAPEPKNNSDNIPRLLLLSGRTADDLNQIFRKTETDSFNVEAIALANEVFQTNMPLHNIRGFTILPKTEHTTALLDEKGDTQRPVCFIFSGMGSQWNGMGKQLLNLPIFAEVIKRCDAILKPRSIDIYEVLLSEDQAMFDDITMSFVAIICTQIALLEVLKKLNIAPDIILGHSAGEVGCAYADGCLTLEEAVLVSYCRGLVSTSIATIKGKMAAVGKGYAEIKDDIPKTVEVACHNALNSSTLSGPAKDIDAYVEKLKNQGIFAKGVNVSNIAYHSQYIVPLAPRHLEILKTIILEPKKRSSKWISTSVPESEWHLPTAQQCSAEYFTNNLLNPVLFEEACNHIPNNAICIEIAPHGLLQTILKRSLPETCTNISLTQRSDKKENLNFLLSSIGKLYIAGCEPAVNNLYPPIEYPVSRGTPSISSYCTWFHGDKDVVTPHLNRPQSTPLSQEKIFVRINDEEGEFSFLKYHQINESTIIPPSFYLYLVWRMLSIQQNVKMDEFPIQFEKIKIYKNMKISVAKQQWFSVLIQGSGSFEVLSREKTSEEETVILTGRIEFIRNVPTTVMTDVDSVESKSLLNADDINKILKDAGFHLGECFQLLTGVNAEGSEFQGKIEWRKNWVTFLDSIMKFQMLPDLQKSKLCFLQFISRIIIIPSVMNSRMLGKQVAAKYCRVTKYFQCKGISIHDAKWKTDDQLAAVKSTSSIKIRKMRFVSYNNPSCQNPGEFVDLCTQISLDTLETTTNTDFKLCICDYTGKFINTIVNYQGKERVIFCDHNGLSKTFSQNNSHLLITEDKMPDIDLSCLEDTHEVYILLIVSKYKSNINSPKLAIILKQRFDDRMFILLKKKLNYSPTVRIENDDITNCRLSNGVNNDVRETVIRPNLDLTSLTLMLSSKTHSTRYIFINNSNGLLIENDPELVSKLLTGLSKVVMKNQDWGSYRYQFSSVIESNNDTSHFRNFLTEVQIKSIFVEFIRPDFSAISQLQNDNSDSQIQFFGIEFSGVNAAGQKLMGLTMVELNDPVSKLDPLLNWYVPEEWSLAEAVSVPVMYAHVFSILNIFEKSIYMPSPTILVNAGEDMLDVEICVSTCLSKNFVVYVAVSNVEQVNRLKHNCPLLEDSSIILNTDGRFEYEVMHKTKSEGVNVVINYKPGIEHFTVTANCLSKFAYYIETVQSNLDENYEIGMSYFLKTLKFAVVPKSITYLLNQRDDIKKQLRRAVSDGIKSGLVRPIHVLNETEGSRRVNNQKEICNGQMSKTTLNSKNGINPDYYRFKQNHSYIILGGEHSEEAWIKLIYWLSEKGGTNFVVLVERLPTHSSQMSQEMECLLTKKNITVSFKSLEKLVSAEDAIKLIRETSLTAPVDSIIFVFANSCPQIIGYMDIASQQVEKNIKIVSLYSGGLEEMELRRSKGFPAFVLHGDIFPQNIPKVMTEFKKILNNHHLNDNREVLYQIIDETNESNLEDGISSLRNYLPKNVASLERIGRHLSERVEFIEMTSQCPKLAHCQGVLPIFIIPSLHASELKSLLLSLMYPVFCASFSENCSSINETAVKLFEHLKLIQPIGPVTLIGETWNSIIACELSSMIKESGRDFKLFLLQGNPVEWNETIRSLNLGNHKNFENVFIQIYGEKLTERLSPSYTKIDGSEMVLSQKNNTALARRCLNVLECQFRNIYDYNVNNVKLENAVFFSKKIAHNITSILSKNCDIVYIKEDDYEKFIESSVIRKTINKQALFSWNV